MGTRIESICFGFRFWTGPNISRKKNGISEPIDSSKNSGVPSYTPPQNRGGERDSLVAFGCKKHIDKNEKIAIIHSEI